ncbi:MAG: phosphoribosylformylglycinamidine synthase [Candidatus Liptonbacteria bacterium]|nr:phosphoribosylformylglycinamidine synthase [Candidatus Liptonbacteria bacterium]
MFSRIDVQSIVADARVATRKRQFEDLGFRGKIEHVAVMDSYVIDAPLNQRQLQRAGKLLANPLLETFSIGALAPTQEFDWVIEIAPRPGVTDNIGTTAREVLEDGLRKKFKAGEKVYCSQALFISGKLSRADAERIAEGIHNPLIQRATVKSRKECERDGGMGKTVPKVKLRALPAGRQVGGGVRKVNLEVDDAELETIGRQGIEDKGGRRACPPELQRRRGPLALDLDAMKAIRDHFRALKRKPTDVELESLAQTWSEHCKHTIFANPLDEIQGGLFREYIKAATEKIMEKKPGFCVSVFKDNSGAIAFDDEYLITHKVETHNSPSALDPFGGAITGIVGVNRDTLGFGLGAKPVINTYGFCFACPEDIRGVNPKDTVEFFRDKERTQKILSPRRIMDGVVAGVNAGGNCSGIPTPQGFVWFDPRYRAKPGVFVGTVGLIPRKRGGRLLHKKGARPGDYIVMAGNRVGLDGIHGATFSSVALDAGSPAAAVQIGDPITQKKLSDVIVKEARDKALYSSITDNGAGGISCSVAEMAREVGLPAGRQGGCKVSLDKVPLKYPGLEPWQIWISESQERMTLAVPKEKWKELFSLFRRRGVEATVIGEFTDSGRCVVEHGKKIVMDIGMDFLHDGWVRRDMQSRAASVRHHEPPKESPETFERTVLAMLARPNIASFAHISSQYDHEVQGGSVVKPLAGRGRVNADATVTRPRLDSKQGVVLAQGLYPTYSDINAYDMAASAIDTAVRAAVVAGAAPDRIALLDNFCWCDSYNPERLAQLKDAVRACYDTAVAYETPFISGKDTMFNDFKGFDAEGKPVAISVPPTLLISAIGIAADAAKCITLDFKMPGDAIYIMGETHDEIGGSEYAVMQSERAKKDYLGNNVPRVHAEKNRNMYRALAQCIARGLVASAVSVGRGGFAVGLCRAALGGMLGADVSLREMPGTHTRDDFALFSESQGRVLVSVDQKKCKEFEARMRGNAYEHVGTVTKEGAVRIRGWDGTQVARIGLRAALEAYRATFRGY